jgi:cell wall-associated NlpC family hydrolase
MRPDVVAAAREHLGTRFGHQGRLAGTSIDCVGLVILVARELGLMAQTFDFTAYARAPDGRSLLHECDRYMARIALLDVEPGDVVALRFGREPQHLALVGDYVHGGLSLIHASTRDGGVVEHHFDATHRQRVVACYRLPA